MGYQREKWHSGLTYRQICENCKSKVEYTDYSLDFRPWYADGFVDCPTCGSHLRHNEKYAMTETGETVEEEAKEIPTEDTREVPEEKGFVAAFCHQCGNKFGEGHRFCFMCGTKRD